MMQKRDERKNVCKPLNKKKEVRGSRGGAENGLPDSTGIGKEGKKSARKDTGRERGGTQPFTL